MTEVLGDLTGAQTTRPETLARLLLEFFDLAVPDSGFDRH